MIGIDSPKAPSPKKPKRRTRSASSSRKLPPKYKSSAPLNSRAAASFDAPSTSKPEPQLPQELSALEAKLLEWFHSKGININPREFAFEAGPGFSYPQIQSVFLFNLSSVVFLSFVRAALAGLVSRGLLVESAIPDMYHTP